MDKKQNTQRHTVVQHKTQEQRVVNKRVKVEHEEDHKVHIEHIHIHVTVRLRLYIIHTSTKSLWSVLICHNRDGGARTWPRFIITI